MRKCVSLATGCWDAPSRKLEILVDPTDDHCHLFIFVFSPEDGIPIQDVATGGRHRGLQSADIQIDEPSVLFWGLEILVLTLFTKRRTVGHRSDREEITLMTFDHERTEAARKQTNLLKPSRQHHSAVAPFWMVSCPKYLAAQEQFDFLSRGQGESCPRFPDRVELTGNQHTPTPWAFLELWLWVFPPWTSDDSLCLWTCFRGALRGSTPGCGKRWWKTILYAPLRNIVCTYSNPTTII